MPNDVRDLIPSIFLQAWNTNHIYQLRPAGVMEELVAEGAVIVTTSNRPPWELQDHGLHEV